MAGFLYSKNHLARNTRKCAPDGISHIARNPGEGRLPQTLAELVFLQVELVVAERGEIEPHDIEHGDHLPARQLVSVNHRPPDRRGAQGVAGENGIGARVFLDQFIPKRGDAAQSAQGLISRALNFVHIIEMQDREFDGR